MLPPRLNRSPIALMRTGTPCSLQTRTLSEATYSSECFPDWSAIGTIETESEQSEEPAIIAIDVRKLDSIGWQTGQRCEVNKMITGT